MEGESFKLQATLLLIVFDSIDGAVTCSVEVQHQIPAYSEDQPSDRHICFRVGINIGDVIADGTDLHGEGVDVAARLQSVCPPGGICVSRAVRDHMREKPDLIFKNFGTLATRKISSDRSKRFVMQKCRRRHLHLYRLRPRSPRCPSLGWAMNSRPCRSLISRLWSSFPFKI